MNHLIREIYVTYIGDELDFIDENRNYFDSVWLHKIARDYYNRPMYDDIIRCWQCGGDIQYYGARRMMCLSSGKIFYVEFGECETCHTPIQVVSEVETTETDLDNIEERSNEQ